MSSYWWVIIWENLEKLIFQVDILPDWGEIPPGQIWPDLGL